MQHDFIKKMVQQGIERALSHADTNAVAELITARQMSWADLVAHTITEPELTGRPTVLENRAAAAIAFADELLAKGKGALFNGEELIAALKQLVTNLHGRGSGGGHSGHSGHGGNSGGGSSDHDAPLVTTSYPMNDATDFQADNNIRISFNEPVKAGSGNIVISNGTDTRTIDVSDNGQVTFDPDGNVNINPAEDLVPNTDYHVQMVGGVITDLAGNPYVGISDPTMLNFTTTIPSDPVLSSSNPFDIFSDFKVDNNIGLFFNEPVKAGHGNIVISNGTDTRTIDVSDTSQVTFESGGTVNINPAEDLLPYTEYHVQIVDGVITDLVGKPYAGISDPTTLNFRPIPSNPVLVFSTPSEYYVTSFKVNSNIQLDFDESVKAGSGNIIISNGTDTRTINIHDTNQVTFNGTEVTINPSKDLVPNTDYQAQMVGDVITDLAGYPYGGTTLNFTAIPSNPELRGSFPLDNATDFQVDNNIQLEFDRSVKAGTGNIVISNGADTRNIDVNDTSQVTFDSYGSYGTVLINPAEDLVPNTVYHVQLADGVVTDLEGDPYAGISDPTSLNFTTIPSNPLLSYSYPSEVLDSGNIQLEFNEDVKAGSGNIVISNGTDTRTIDISDTSQVKFGPDRDGGNQKGVTIDPAENWVPNTDYHVQMAGGVITDLAGNPYAGINDPTTFNFTIMRSDPVLSLPPGYVTDFQVDSNIELFFDEPVKAGSGNIVIRHGTDFRTIDVSDTSQVTFDDSNHVIINPTEDLVPNTDYIVELPDGVVTDLAGNPYLGRVIDPLIYEPYHGGGLSFTTIPSNPVLFTSDPSDNATGFQVDSNIHLEFNEPVKAGSGNIVISNGTDTRIIDINDTGQVIFSDDRKVIINPAEDLVPNTVYHVQLAGDVITDLVGNPFAGINDLTTLNFTTA